MFEQEPVNASIMLIDDNPDSLNLLSDLLLGAGFMVRAFPSGRLALQALNDYTPSLVILDIDMPVMNGYEICRQLKLNRNVSDVPVIFISAYSNAQEKVAAFEAGGVDYITKPFQITEVMVRVKTQLDLAGHRRALQHAKDQMELQVRQRTAELDDSNRALLQSNSKLQDLYRHIERVREEEKARIAREIHDELGAYLTVMMMDVSMLQSRMEHGERDKFIMNKLTDIKRLLTDTSLTTERIVSELRPSVLDNLGLTEAIEWQAQEFASRVGIHCEVHAEAAPVNVRNYAATTIFRVFQESMTNIFKHAKASNIWVNMRVHDNRFVLTVEDDGIGIVTDWESDNLAHGIRGMHERASSLDGELFLLNRDQTGTRLKLVVPLASLLDQPELEPSCTTGNASVNDTLLV